MCKISLPINENPPITHFSKDFFPLSIIFSEISAIRYQWLFNYYYNFEILSCNSLVFLNENWFKSENIFNMENYIRLPTRYIDYAAICKIIINMMKQKFYCVGSFKDIKHDNAYHDFLLYEFDNSTNNVTYIRHLEKNDVKKIIIEFSEFLDPINNSVDFERALLFFQLNENYNYGGYKIKNLKVQISEYIDLNKNRLGINAVYKFINYLHELNSVEELIDIKRNLLLLYEHKDLMRKRLKYIYGENAFFDYELINRYGKVADEFRILLQSYIEFERSSDLKDVRSLCQIKPLAFEIEKLINQEVSILKNVL